MNVILLGRHSCVTWKIIVSNVGDKTKFHLEQISTSISWEIFDRFQIQRPFHNQCIKSFHFSAKFKIGNSAFWLSNNFSHFFENLSSKMLHVKWIVFSIVLKIHRYRDVKNLKLLFRRTKRPALIFLKQRLKITLRCIKLQWLERAWTAIFSPFTLFRDT